MLSLIAPQIDSVRKKKTLSLPPLSGSLTMDSGIVVLLFRLRLRLFLRSSNAAPANEVLARIFRFHLLPSRGLKPGGKKKIRTKR